MLTRRRFLTHLAAGALTGPGILRATVDATASLPHLSASMWIYLWDIVDEGYDTVMGRLRDRGLSSISLATAYHAGKFLAPHNPRRKVAFLEDGTVMFQPRASLYDRISPRVNSLVASGHDLREARRETERRGLQLRSWVVCCHNTPLGMAHPDLVSRTAFGDPLFHNLCPSHEAVRGFFRSLVKDIASYGVDRIELEALQFQGYAHGYHHEREGIPLTTGTRFLLGLCFCDACMQNAASAHLDLHPLRDFTRTTLEQLFSDPERTNGTYPAIEQLPDALLGPFLEWRTGVVCTLLEDLQASAGNVPLRHMMSVDPAARRMVSVDPSTSARITGGILALGYVKDGEALREPLASLLAVIPSRELTLGFQVGLPESGGRIEFLDRLSTARSLGVTSFNFYNYGFIPLRNLGWIEEGLQG